MLLTLLLDPHGFFLPEFWQIVAIIFVTVGAIIWLVVALVRRLWRSESQLARLSCRLIVLVLIIAIMYFWVGPMHLRL
jgi:type III secretory pathway component EscS